MSLDRVQPTVSVVLPVYNAGAALPYAVASILRQTLMDWELIVIDDGSTDGCVATVNPRADRIRMIRDGRNLGLAARLNQGIDLARGKYLARMDSDDIAYPERLETQVAFLKTHPDIDLVASRMLLFRDDGQVIGLSPFRGTHAEICAMPWRGFFLAHPTWMGKTEWFRCHRYHLPQFERAEDQELLLRTYRSSRFACLPQVLLGYRKSGLSLEKILTARRSLARAQWSVNLHQGHLGQAVLGFSVCVAKAVMDIAISAVGGEHLFVARMARSAPAEAVERWMKVWSESQSLTGALVAEDGARDGM